MAPSIDKITAAFVDGYIDMTADEQRLAQAVYRLLATGEPVTPKAIAAAAPGWSVQDVEARLDTSPAVFRDENGAIVGFWGAAAGRVSEHRMDIDGLGTSWTWCAYDTLYIPPLFDATAHISSPCATTGDLVRLTVSASGVTDVEPAGAVVSLLLPDKPFDDDVRQTFCHYSNFFSSPEAADQWVQANPETFWLPLAEGFEVAERANAAVFPALVGEEATS